MKNSLITFAAACLLFVAGPSFATTKSVSHQLDLNGISHIELSHSVGNLRIERSDSLSNGVAMGQLTGTIKAGKKGWFRGSEDITNINLDLTNRGDTLHIVFEHDNAEADYVLTIPAVASLSIKLGVGNLVAALTAASTEIKIGVGNAELTTDLASIGAINLATGVGDTGITGVLQQHTARAIVTSKTQATGPGHNLLNVKVGVGNASLELIHQ